MEPASAYATPAGANLPHRLLAGVGMLAIALGMAVLCGWAFDVAALKSGMKGWVAMKANTAACFVLLGIALALPAREASHARRRTAAAHFGRACGWLAGAIGLLSLLQYATGADFGLDQVLVTEPFDATLTSHPGRMAPETAVCFVLLAFALEIGVARQECASSSVAAVFSGVLACLLAVLAACSYLTPSFGSHGWWGVTVMALPAALMFLVLGATLVLAHWRRGCFVWAIGRMTTAAFAIGLVLLALIDSHSGRSQAEMNEAARQRAELEAIASANSEIAAGLVAAENECRGFLLTGNERFGVGFAAAVIRCRRLMAIQRGRMLADPGQARQFARLETQAETTIAWLQRVMATPRSGLADAARDAVVWEGADLMAATQAIFVGANAADRRALRLIDEEADRLMGNSYAIIMGGAVLSFAIFLLVLLGLNRAEIGRKRAERAAQLHSAIIESSEDAIIGKDLAGRITAWNRGAEKIYGYTPAEMIGGTTLRLIPADRHDEEDQIMARIRAGQRVEHFETVRCTAHGKLVDLSITASPIRDEHGVVVGVSKVARVITERKAAEAALRDANLHLERRVAERTAELTFSKELMDKAGQMARVGGWEVDLERDKVHWSPVVHEIHEVDPDYVPTLAAGINFYAPESLPIISAAVQRASTTAEPFDLELQIITAKGNRRWVRTMGQAIAERGRIGRLIGVFQDITARRHAADELKQQRDELAAANRELESFSHSVSHDLRAPLRSIDGFSKIALTQHANELSSDARDALAVVRACSQQMGQLIDDLLAFSRLGRQPLQRELISPDSLVRESLTLLHSELAGRRVELVRGELPACEGDAGLLKLVWLNLLSNALKYTRKREAARIQIGSHVHAGATVYFVRDNGVGFKMAYAGKLFGVFQRLHRAEDYEGSGVGLATAQRIVQRHGGRIWAEAELNQGATFFFTLAPPGKIS